MPFKGEFKMEKAMKKMEHPVKEMMKNKGQMMMDEKEMEKMMNSQKDKSGIKKGKM